MKKSLSILLTALIFVQTILVALTVVGAEIPDGPLSFAKDYHNVGEAVEIVKGNLPDDAQIKWYSGNTLRTTGDSYTLAESDLCSFIKVVAESGGQVVAEDRFYFSNIPVVTIDVEDGEEITSKDDYYDATMKITGNSEDDLQYDGETEIKGRGNSTWGFDKKPYKLKLDKSTDLFGMGKNKHWVLLANYLDVSLMRNAVASDFAAAIGGIQYQKSVWVELVVNGEYYGNYQLVEHVRIDEKTRVPIYNWEDAAEEISEAVLEKEEVNGFTEDDADEVKDMLESDFNWITTDEFTYGGKTYKVSDYYEIPENIMQGILFEISDEYDEFSKFKTSDNTPVMVNSPEFIATNTEYFNQLKAYVQKVENAIRSTDGCITENGKKVSYAEFINYDTLIDYSLVSLFLSNEVGYKSTYFYLDENSKLNFGPPWDFDSSQGSITPWGDKEGGGTEWWNIWDKCTWYRHLQKDETFILKFRVRYLEMLPYLENLVKDGGTLDQWYNKLKASATVNDKLWANSLRKTLAEKGNTPRSFENDFKALKKWIKDRMSWVTKNFQTDKKAIENFRQWNGQAPEDNISIFPEKTIITDAKATYSIEYKDAEFLIQAPYCSNVTVYVNKIPLGSYAVQDSRVNVTVPKEAFDKGKTNVITVRNTNNLKTYNALSFFASNPCGGGHASTVIIPAEPAACDSPGLTEGEYCEICGVVIREQEETGFEPHKEQIVKGKAATCTENGLTDGAYCSVCLTEIKAQEVIPMTAHKFVNGVCSCGEKEAKDDANIDAKPDTNIDAKPDANKKVTLKKPKVKITRYGKGKVKIVYTQVKGAKKYQVSYQLKGKKKATIKTFSAKKKVTKILKLKSKKTYTIKVRAYKNKSTYSKWTTAKKLKLK